MEYAYDRPGWKYLANMLEHWLPLTPREDHITDYHYPINFSWLMHYQRTVKAYNELINTYANNTKAKNKLLEILKRNDMLKGKDRVYFNFTQSHWTEWQDKHHTHVSVESIGEFGINERL